MSATLIYDQSGRPAIPQQLYPTGTAEEVVAAIDKAGQMRGTPMEQLCEIAGRACYDSFGRGRNSADFHKHILEVGHLSVIEHAVFTVEISGPAGSTWNTLTDMHNRPSLWVNLNTSISKPRITLNLRHVLEWKKTSGPGICTNIHSHMALSRFAHQLAPAIQPHGLEFTTGPHDPTWTLVSPETDEEKWVTLLLTGSRGFSHELVRHGDYTAISQRSTRYVDESTSPWVRHPLETAFRREHPKYREEESDTGAVDNGLSEDAQGTYRAATTSLEAWLIARGVDKTTARKQARGAARGYLGNALYTEVVFSASVAQWKHMLRMRASAAADAEIREVFCQALTELKRSQYGNCFEGWGLEPSPDGIGQVLKVEAVQTAKA